MKSSSAAPADSDTSLVRLLEDSFLEGGDAECALASRVPREIWERALLGPLREFLARPSKGFRTRLVALGWRLGADREKELPPELALLVEGLHAGSLIIDDIEDDSEVRRGAPALHRRHGVPLALNAGNWLYFWAQGLLARVPFDDGARLVAHERLTSAVLRCHEGQALDLTVHVADVPQADVPPIVLATSRLKTGSLLGLAALLGALASGTSRPRLEAIAAFGRAAGVGLQALDDLSGLVNLARREKAIEDLRHGRATWPWAWLASSLPSERYERLRRELRGVHCAETATALAERMRLRLSSSGLGRARAMLADPAAKLRGVVGDGAWYDELRAEFASLEESYVAE